MSLRAPNLGWRRRAFKVVLAALAVALLAPPAGAGNWIKGGAMDFERDVAVYFLRFVAEPGEGLMTIRCDTRDGLWIDAGVGGTDALPPNAMPGAHLGAVFTFVRADGTRDVWTSGPLVIRADGTALVSIVGAAALPLGDELLVETERLDITIGGATRSVPLAQTLADLEALAARCDGWPGRVFELR